MGDSLQCDQSFSTFHIDNKVVKVNKKLRITHMTKESIDNDITCFLDIEINSFREEVIVLEREKKLPPMTQEANNIFENGNF